MQRPRADGRPAAFGRRPAAWACGLLGLSALCAPAAATRIIGSDGKEYSYHGLRHHHRPGHRRRAGAAPQQHAARMLNHLRSGRARANGTAEEPPRRIPPGQHLVTSSGMSGKREAEHSDARSVRMKMMRADRCAGLPRESADFGECRGFMRDLCEPRSSMETQLLLQHLCGKFFMGAGQAAVHFDLRGVHSDAFSAAAAQHSRDGAGASAPAGASTAGRGSPEEAAERAAAGGAALASPSEATAPPAALGRINGMDAQAPMPEQGFSGRLVRHLDAETHVSDWQQEYGPKAKRRMSYEDICALYPHNQWCIINEHSGTRSRSRSRGRPPPRPAPRRPPEPSRPPAPWHEAVRESVGDPAGEARRAVQAGLGVGGDATEDTAKKGIGKEDEDDAGPGRHGVDGSARERGASEGAGGSPPGRQRRGGGGGPGSSGAGASGGAEAAREASAGEPQGTGEGSEDATSGAAEGLGGGGAAAPASAERGADAAAAEASPRGRLPEARRSGGGGGGQPSDAPSAERMEDGGREDDGDTLDHGRPAPTEPTTTSTVPVFGAPRAEESAGWWPFSWP